MKRKLVFLLTALVWVIGSQMFIRSASATTPLTRAVIQLIRNDVDLIPEGEDARPAEISDRMEPGDALATARQSFAELYFNDGSLARVGESVLFRFVPNTRTFRLNNGTVLLLIPPGQGRTRLQTPNATAGIRGSALFVRYIRETDTTIVGALTDSGIEVYNEDETERYELEAGQVALVIEDRIERIYQMDLERFYETSELAQGLYLGETDLLATRREIETVAQLESVVLVRAETLTALEGYEFDDSGDVQETPAFTRMSATEEDLEDAGLVPSPAATFPVDDEAGDRPSQQIDRILDATEVQNTPTGDGRSPATPDIRQPEPDRPSPDNERPEPERPNPGNERPTPERPNPGNERPEPTPQRPEPTPQRPEPERPEPDDERPEPDDDRPEPDDDRPEPDVERPEPERPEPDPERPEIPPGQDENPPNRPENDDIGGPTGPDEGVIDVEAGEG